MFKDFESYRSNDNAQIHKPERDSRGTFIPIEEIEDPDAEDAVYAHVEESLLGTQDEEAPIEEGIFNIPEEQETIEDVDVKSLMEKEQEDIRSGKYDDVNYSERMDEQIWENALDETVNPFPLVSEKDRPINQDRYRHKHTDPNAKPKPTLDRKIQQENSALLRDIADNGGIIAQESPEDFFNHVARHIDASETDLDTPQNFADVA